jgi:hypothetical protein
MGLIDNGHPCPCMEGKLNCLVSCEWQKENSMFESAKRQADKKLYEWMKENNLTSDLIRQQKDLEPGIQAIVNEKPWELYG